MDRRTDGRTDRRTGAKDASKKYFLFSSHHWLKTQDNEGDIHNVEDDADVDNNYIWQ